MSLAAGFLLLFLLFVGQALGFWPEAIAAATGSMSIKMTNLDYLKNSNCTSNVWMSAILSENDWTDVFYGFVMKDKHALINREEMDQP